MTIRWAIFCAAVVIFPMHVAHAVTPAKKPVVKAAKASAKRSVKPAPMLRGKTETLTCRDGTEDRHARIGVVLIGGRMDSFAYYSKWKPRTCSIYLQRNRDGYSKWTDNGDVTSVRLDRGLLLIEHRKGEYRFIFREIDRERYCGMDGTINGTLTLRKGSERCELAGVMEEGVPLGQAAAYMEQNQRAAASTATAAIAPPRQPIARNPYPSLPPDAAVIIGD